MKKWISIVAIAALSACARFEKSSGAATSADSPAKPNSTNAAPGGAAGSETNAPSSGATNRLPALVPPQPQRRLFKLALDEFWRIELPNGKRFDASGLAFAGTNMLVVADAIQTPFYLRLGEEHLATLARTEIFTPQQMIEPLGQLRSRYDFEGLARDDAGRIYVCEEGQRLVLRFDPATKKVERLPIDWTPVSKYFLNPTGNAAWEGVAVGGGKLWVANERERPRIIELDLETLKILGDFAPEASFWGLVLHYSDLCYFDGKLFVLLRHHRVILEVDPAFRAVVAEYDYRAIEDAPEHEYRKDYPTGVMEGLAVDKDYFWLVTDNNGFPRIADPADTRPTLFRCKRPR